MDPRYDYGQGIFFDADKDESDEIDCFELAQEVSELNEKVKILRSFNSDLLEERKTCRNLLMASRLFPAETVDCPDLPRLLALYINHVDSVVYNTDSLVEDYCVNDPVFKILDFDRSSGNITGAIEFPDRSVQFVCETLVVDGMIIGVKTIRVPDGSYFYDKIKECIMSFVSEMSESDVMFSELDFAVNTGLFSIEKIERFASESSEKDNVRINCNAIGGAYRIDIIAGLSMVGNGCAFLTSSDVVDIAISCNSSTKKCPMTIAYQSIRSILREAEFVIAEEMSK
jgi:hypothetical protein